MQEPIQTPSPAVIPGSNQSPAYLTLLAMHDAFEARWNAARAPAGATELCMWDMQRIIDELPCQRQLSEVLLEAAELLDEWVKVGAPASAEEIALIEAVKALVPKIRVQMVSNGIPAYQSDFSDQSLAITTAEGLASGCKKAERVEDTADLMRFNLKGGYIRVFALPA